jgi:metal-responsive CopG/Arc/MetJ family transcriptional regulator
VDERQRMTITLTKNAAEVLDGLAKQTGKSKNEVLRDALFLEKYAQDAWQERGRIIVERDGDKREVIPH